MPDMLSTNKLKKVLLRRVAKTAAAFDMFPDEGSVVVGFSGGADSATLVDILHELAKRWRKKVRFVPAMVDAGFFEIPQERINALEDFCRKRGMELSVIRCHEISERTRSERNPFPPCFTCSRMRRKALLEFANSIGAQTIALGHHQDDLLETFFLNILLSRRISAILPNQPLFGGLFRIVRPMILVEEKYIKRYALLRAFPTIEKNCPFAGNTEREWIKGLLRRIESERPGTRKNILRSLFHPKPEYLWGRYRHLADRLLR